ncbi:cyclic AMP-dependent transcription factor ATF-3-like isoform X2 [Ptychodera flava]|uniref:cyclic AMP-dependent transcription factor ATF-3-like isoform X2 n=1 Tax=Ptychodera flava TaxID=63121 RepID=UPI003969E006
MFVNFFQLTTSHCVIDRGHHKMNGNTHHHQHHNSTHTADSGDITKTPLLLLAAGSTSSGWQDLVCSGGHTAGSNASAQSGSSSRTELTIDMDSVRKEQNAEEERRQRRREQNKLAAERYRNRKRESTDSLHKESERLQEANAALHEKIRALEHHKNFLTRLLGQVRPSAILQMPSFPGSMKLMF